MEDFFFDAAGHKLGRPEQSMAIADIQIGLVNGYRFDMGGKVAQQIHDLARNRLVAGHATGYDDGMRAAAAGFEHGHGRAHAKAAGFIAGGCHHTAIGVSAYQNAFPPELRTIKLFHRSEKSVHIDMQDHDNFDSR